MDDVRVVELGDGLGLGLEAQQGGGVGGQVGAEQLEGDLALERELPGEVDLPHSRRSRAGAGPDNRRGCGR